MDMQPMDSSSFRDLDDIIAEQLPQLRGASEMHKMLIAREDYLASSRQNMPSFLPITFTIKPFKTVEAASTVETNFPGKQRNPHSAVDSLPPVIVIAIGCLIILVLIDIGQRYTARRHPHL